ncbi:NUDIX domain-containing protein [Pelagibaculum spongiae]|uniref:DNA mismatch repair protein MutT n=1 Tax=Pelagibaculum spongiae TaxID=2080658 RepID=A0A2V1H3P6_9GAMM|nr:NUDIX hydrolase [Pelagibaculum spongiae]PVZ71807.1 DNA mismatch repair protein MutT [Pelagibaculum spongiae]
MRLLKTAFHPELSKSDVSSTSKHIIIERHAARAIVLRDSDILLLFTERYHDYSLPGGGIDEGEDEVEGLIRELKEETGAQGICNVQPFARYDEYRPWYKTDADIIHMISHCYTCEIDDQLGDTAYESHEVSNGMKPIWINIDTAIAHNEDVIANSPKKGLSIERETFMLKVIAEELIAS